MHRRVIALRFSTEVVVALNLLRLFHRWLGLTLSLIVVAMALSGAILIFHDTILRSNWPELTAPIKPGQEDLYPDILSRLERRFREPGIKLIKFPDQGMNAFRLWIKDDSEVLVHTASGEIITRWVWNETLTSILFEFHAHLFAGDFGEQVIGCIGLLVLGFVLSGLVLWWPRRRAFRLRFIFPRAVSSRHFMRSHAAMGVIFSAAIFFFTLTGVTMVFYRPVATLLTSLLDSNPPLTPSARLLPSDQPMRAWKDILRTLAKTLPDGKLVYYIPPRPDNAAMTFRKRMPGEWHPNGRSFILINPYTNDVLQSIDARQQQFGMRLVEKFYPLHASKVGGWPYTLFALITSGALITLVISGCLSFFCHKTFHARDG